MPGLIESPRSSRRASCVRTGEAVLEDFVRALAWSPSGRLLVAVTLEGTAHLRDAAGVWHGVPGLHNGGAFSCAWSPDGSRFVTGGGDGRVFLHDRGTMSLVTDALVEEAWVEHIAWSPDGRAFAAAAGRSVRVFTRDAERVGDPIRHDGVVTSLRWFGPPDAILTTSHGGARILALDTGVARRWSSDGAVFVARLSRDRRFLALGKHDGCLHVWDLVDDREVMIAGYRRKIGALAWSDRASLLASVGGKEIAVWPFDATGPRDREHVEIAPHRGVVTSLEFTPGGARLVSVGDDGLLHVARTDSWGSDFLDATGVPLSSLAMSADGRNVAAAGKQGRVFTWRLGACDGN